MDDKSLFREFFRELLLTVALLVPAAVFVASFVFLTIYIFGFLHEGGEIVGHIAIIAYIILVPLFLLYGHKWYDRLGRAVKSRVSRLKPQDTGQTSHADAIEKHEHVHTSFVPKSVPTKLMEYVVGAVMLLAYAVLTICFFSFVPWLGSTFYGFHSFMPWLGSMFVVMFVIIVFAYILFALLFLLHFGKCHDRVCTAIKSRIPGWFRKPQGKYF